MTGTLQKEFRTGRNSPFRMEVTILARCTGGVDEGDVGFEIQGFKGFKGLGDLGGGELRLCRNPAFSKKWSRERQVA
jgi:hypothetical protein